MPSANKARGSRFELDLERALDELGLPTPRRPRQTGHKDIGDIHVGEDLVVQAKNWGDVASALREGVAGAEAQALEAGRSYGVAVIKRRGRHARDAYVGMTLATFARLYNSRRWES